MTTPGSPTRQILPDEKGPTCANFLARAAAYFADRGITRIEALMTDNAWEYPWSLRTVCADLSIRQIYIKPHCPWQNGKVERFNRTLASEWAYRHPLRQQRRPRSRPCTMVGDLQHCPTPQRTRRTPTDQPPVTNLMAGYT
nr:integrase core domain-containing protein [Occultella kanbiaonis]